MAIVISYYNTNSVWKIINCRQISENIIVDYSLDNFGRSALVAKYA